MRADALLTAALFGLPDDWPWRWIWIGAAALAVLLIAVSLWRNGRRGWGWVIVGFLIVIVLVFWRAMWTMIQNDPRTPQRSRFASTGWLRGGGSRGRW